MKKILYLFIFMIPIAIIFGGVASILGVFLGPIFYRLADIPVLIGDSAGLISPVFSITTVLLYFATFITPPAVIASCVGKIIGWLTFKAQCQNSTLAGIAGIWSGVIIYATHSMISLYHFGTLRFLTHDITIATVFQDSEVILGGATWWVLLLISIEVLTIITYSFSESRKAILYKPGFQK